MALIFLSRLKRWENDLEPDLLFVCVCSVLPDGTVIGIQFDSRSKLLNLLYLDEEHICQENTKQCSIWICDDFIFFVYQNLLLILKHIWILWTQLKIFRIKDLVELACLHYGQRCHAHWKWWGTWFLSLVNFECSFQKTKNSRITCSIFDTIKPVWLNCSAIHIISC